MTSASISGLVSGLDTASIIDQLMQLEAVPQTRLRSQQSTQKQVLAALQSLNTDIALLGSKTEALTKAESWKTLKATSSNPLVAVSGAPTAATSFSVTVDKVASAGQTVYANATLLDTVVTTGAVSLHTPDGQDLAVPMGTSGSLTLSELATAINGLKAGVTATTVKTGTNAYQLLLSSDATGLKDKITLTNVGGLGAENAQAGTDAQISIGNLGISATSSTNTFTDIVPGVTLTVSPAAIGSIGLTTGTPTTASVTVARDTSSVKSGVGALVDQINKLLTSIDTQTAGKSATTAAGILAGDQTARSIRDALSESIFGSGTTSLASVGIQTDKTGMLVFDGAAFDKAYAADPAGTEAMFASGRTTDVVTGATTATDGWLARVARITKAASDSKIGTLTSAIAGRNSTISQMDDSIAAWDLRLELRRTSLQQTYTALETALSNMQSQGNWLAGQIAQLPKSS